MSTVRMKRPFEENDNLVVEKRVEENVLGDDCSLCYNEIENPVMYKKNTFDKWYGTTVCLDCILYLKRTQYNDYLNNVQTTDCKRTLKRLLEIGPPMWVNDEHIFKNVDYNQDEHIIEFKCNHEITSARLDGSVDGDERTQLWENLKHMREQNE